MGRFIELELPIQKMIELYKLGNSDGVIARQLGIKQQTVSYRLRKLGYEPHFKKLEPMLEKDGQWLCERCDVYKSKDDFIYTNNQKLRFRFCRSCKHKASTEAIRKTYISYIRNRIRHIRHQVKGTDTPFDINAEYCIDLWNRQNGRCFYSDELLKINNTNQARHNHNSASLDRIIPTRGYVEENVVWCIQRINVMKNDATLDEMKIYMPYWYERIVRFLEPHKF